MIFYLLMGLPFSYYFINLCIKDTEYEKICNDNKQNLGNAAFVVGDAVVILGGLIVVFIWPYHAIHYIMNYAKKRGGKDL